MRGGVPPSGKYYYNQTPDFRAGPVRGLFETDSGPPPGGPENNAKNGPEIPLSTPP